MSYLWLSGMRTFLVLESRSGLPLVSPTFALVESFDLGTLNAEPGHEALLVESEGVNAAMQCVGVHRASRPFIHYDEARGGSDGPSVRCIYPIDRLLIHEEKRVAEFLDTSLQPIRCSRRAVAAGALAVHEEDAFATLGADEKAGFDDIRKNKDSHRIGRDFARGRVLRVKLAQCFARLAGQVGGRFVRWEQDSGGEQESDREF